MLRRKYEHSQVSRLYKMINATINDQSVQNQASTEPMGVDVTPKAVEQTPSTPVNSAVPTPPQTDTPPNFNETPSKPKKKKRFDVKMIAGVFALLLIVVGASAGFFLSQQSQDLRQQASTDDDAYGRECTIDYHCAGFGENARCENGFCVSDSTAHNCTAAEGGEWDPDRNDGEGGCVYPGGAKLRYKLTQTCSETNNTCPDGCNTNTGYCNPTQPGETDNPLIILSNEMIESGTTLFQGVNDDGTYNGSVVTAHQFNNHNVQVSGFYWYPPGDPGGQRYVIGLPSTMAAVIQASTNNTELWEELNIGDPSDGSSIDLRPRLICDTAGAYNVGICSGNTITTVDQYGNIITLSGTIIDGVFYLNDEGYNQLVNLGQTWVSNETGCNDGVNDGTATSPTNTNFEGDCISWHWTTCLDQGSGVGGYGCDVGTGGGSGGGGGTSYSCNSTCTSNDQCSDLGLFCDTETSNRCRLQTNPTSEACEPPVTTTDPICKDIAILDTDDNILDPLTTNFSIGMSLKFRCASEDPNSLVTNYEFKITEPNGTIVDGTTINPADSSTISKVYEINQYLDHEVQCRVCEASGCQDWINIIN